MDKPTLILTVGLPRIGKSTWAKEQCFPIVSPDAIRLVLTGQAFVKEAEDMVWTYAKYMVKSLFTAGHSVVILDATNTTRKRRAEWVSDAWTTMVKVFEIDPQLCIDRARKDDKEYLVPVIERMANQFEYIDPKEEGLTVCYMDWIEKVDCPPDRFYLIDPEDIKIHR